MGNIYALMAGINNYRSPRVRNLLGCRNDLADATAFLEQRRSPGTALHIKQLIDGQATGEAIVAGFRDHLGQARSGDVALFWFCGHGSTASVPRRFWHLEPDGERLQTLVCADSRHDGRPDLLDKELAVLLDEVASGGCHVVAVLDCCHSGGASRGPQTRARSVRSTTLQTTLLADLPQRYAKGASPIRHMLLAACQPEELAGENTIDGAERGYFTWSLVRALRRTGPDISYRELAALACNEVERWSLTQHPLVFPAGPGMADQRVLGGGLVTAPPSVTMRHGRDGWEVNAGLCHAIEDATRFAVAGPQPAREVRIKRVQTGRSLVEPTGWKPDPMRIYPMVLSYAAAPVAMVTITGAVDPLVAKRLRGAVGSGGSHVKVVDFAHAEMILSPGPRPNMVHLSGRDGEPLWDLVVDGSGRAAASDLAHIARWRQVKNRRNPFSSLAKAVSLEIVEPLPGDQVVRPDSAAALPGADGAFRFCYRFSNGRWCAPRRFMRLRNNTQQSVYCVLLNLTERFKIDADLFREGLLRPKAVAAVAEGQPIEFQLPQGIPVRPGTYFRQWLMLVVSTDAFSAAPYELPELVQGRRDNLLGRPRDAVVARNTSDWWTTVLPVITEVPKPPGS